MAHTHHVRPRLFFITTNEEKNEEYSKIRWHETLLDDYRENSEENK